MKFDIHLKLVKLVFYTSSNYISSSYTGTVFTVSFFITIRLFTDVLILTGDADHPAFENNTFNVGFLLN